MFMIVDATQTPWGDEEFLGAKLSRDEVMNTPISTDLYEILDRMVEDEPRLRRFIRGVDETFS
jgi:hypothetical protein